MYGIHPQGDGLLGCFCLFFAVVLVWAFCLRVVAPAARIVWRRLHERPIAAIGAGVICIAAGLGGAVWLVTIEWEKTGVLCFAVVGFGVFAVSGGVFGLLQARQPS